MTSEETGQVNNVIVICDKCNERHRGTIRIIKHKSKHKIYQQRVYYNSKLCKKCEEELKNKELNNIHKQVA